MSLSDLELIQLVDSVKEKQKGPQGEPGVGVASIEQFDETSFTITLTNGASKKVVLPAAVDGQPGEPGPAGPQGEPGPAGRNGAKGRDGTDGTVGAQGLPGVSLDTAVVNANGHLLLGLTDGAVIDVGRVVGPDGATGPAGGMGPAGRDGADGASLLSGPRAPQESDGKNGDFWIDISVPGFTLWKRDGNGWTMQADLRVIIQPGPVTAVSGGGGEGGSGDHAGALNTRDVALTHPTGFNVSLKDLPNPGKLKTQEDANNYIIKAIESAMVFVGEKAPDPAVNGQLWWSTKDDELTLYIRIDDVWVPASPPVSLEGIEAGLANVDAELMRVNANIAMNKKDIDDAVLDINLLSQKGENAALLNEENTFTKKNVFEGLEIAAPGNDWSEPTFEIKGTAQTGTEDSRILFSIPASGQNGKMEIRYRGAVVSDDAVSNKKYVDGKARASQIALDPFVDPDPESTFRDEDDVRGLYQDDLNNYTAQRIFDARRKQTRVQTNVDLNQNTIIDGQWKFVKPSQGTAFPESGEFMALDAQGNATTKWDEVVQLRVNGTDYLDTTGLGEIRKGAVIIIQDVILNSFAQYSCTKSNFIGNPQGGQFWVELDVRVYISRAIGIAPEDEVCEIRVTSPHPAISTYGEPPVVSDDGFLWYDEESKKLYVSDWDDEQDNNGDAEWVEVGASPDLTDYLKKSGGQMTGELSFKATGDGEYWSYIRALRPNAWDKQQENHGLILDIGNTNTFKQQFKIRGRSNRDLFEIKDDGSASSTIRGRLNCTEALKVSGKDVATEEYVQKQLVKDVATKEYVQQQVAAAENDFYWKWYPDPSNTAINGQLHWFLFNDNYEFNIPTTSRNGVINLPDFERVSFPEPFTIYSRDESGTTVIAFGTLTSTRVHSNGAGTQYFDARVDPKNMIIWRPDELAEGTMVYCKISGLIP